MGKKDKTAATPAKTEKAEAAPKAPKAEKPKYGVPELATAMGVKASSVRVALRNAEIDKKGKTYGWDSKAEMQVVIDKLKASKKPRAAKAVEEDEEDDAE